jgi:transposase
LNADTSLTVVFQDEVHYQVQTSVTTKWALKGSKPKVMSKPGKQSVAYSGYLIPDTGELIVNKPGWFNYETVIQSFRDFIAAVPSKNDGKYCMVLDNAPWHKKAIRLIWTEELPEYQDIREKMTYLNLPPYSPDLNPIEQVWRITRREMTHNRYYPNIESLETALDEYYSIFRKPNAKLSALCSFKSFREDTDAKVA